MTRTIIAIAAAALLSNSAHAGSPVLMPTMVKVGTPSFAGAKMMGSPKIGEGTAVLTPRSTVTEKSVISGGVLNQKAISLPKSLYPAIP